MTVYTVNDRFVTTGRPSLSPLSKAAVDRSNSFCIFVRLKIKRLNEIRSFMIAEIRSLYFHIIFFSRTRRPPLPSRFVARVAQIRTFTSKLITFLFFFSLNKFPRYLHTFITYEAFSCSPIEDPRDTIRRFADIESNHSS